MSEDHSPDIPPAPRARLKRLRFLAILFAVLLLGLVSFVFGIFISVASDLPSLTRFSHLENARSSVLLDDLGHPLGVLSQQNRVIVTPSQIPQIVKEAVIAIEDRRFQTNNGVDVRAIARAFIQDLRHKGSLQGASTIEQQFIKNALQAQSHRTIFEKLRETALAYQLSRKWSKDKILTAYLNTIYFGNGAYGIESAAHTYFGQDVNHEKCGTLNRQLCVEQMKPWEAALLAGVIQSPSRFDPASHPMAAKARRNVVLRQMFDQGYLTRRVYEASIGQALPARQDIQLPKQQTVEGVNAGYFTSWVRQQVVERYGAARAFNGGLRITTTLDLELQRAAEQAVNGYLPGPGGATASLVAIENSTGEVRAMVGGRNYAESPFNLATTGERQPGSAFKAFDLAAALESGISPESTWTSKQKLFILGPPGARERFVVHNDENFYSGQNTLTGATAASDNSIYAEVGLKVGTKRIARVAHEMGITTPLSTNPAMTIGGLTTGVTPLDMAHAYETIAHGGRRVSGTLSEYEAPVGIQEVDAGTGTLPDGAHRDINQVKTRAVLPASVATTETSMLETVLQYGTARAAAIGQFAAGKTGTTSNYGDAWFVGWNSKYTVAVWVGYPDKLVPMTTEFNGGPVLGGTFPALIWHNFITASLQIDKTRAEAAAQQKAAAGRPSGPSTTSTTEGTGQSSARPGAGPGQTPPGAGRTTSGPSAPAGGGATGNRAGPGAGAGPAPSQSAAPTPSSSPTNTTPENPAPATPPPAPSTPPSSSSPSPTGGVSPSGK